MLRIPRLSVSQDYTSNERIAFPSAETLAFCQPILNFERITFLSASLNFERIAFLLVLLSESTDASNTSPFRRQAMHERHSEVSQHATL